MDSRLLTIMEGEHRTFWSAAATLPQLLPESAVPDVIVGLTRDYLPAAALDLAMHRSKPRHCGLGKAPSPRRVWNPALRLPANAAGIPHRRGLMQPRRFAGALQNSLESIKSLREIILLILLILNILLILSDWRLHDNNINSP